MRELIRGHPKFNLAAFLARNAILLLFDQNKGQSACMAVQTLPFRRVQLEEPSSFSVDADLDALAVACGVDPNNFDQLESTLRKRYKIKVEDTVRLWLSRPLYESGLDWLKDLNVEEQEQDERDGPKSLTPLQVSGDDYFFIFPVVRGTPVDYENLKSDYQKKFESLSKEKKQLIEDMWASVRESIS